MSLSLWRSLRSIHAMLSSIKQDHLSKRKQNCDEYNFCQKLPVGPRTSDSSDGLGCLYSVQKRIFCPIRGYGDAHSPAFLHLNAWEPSSEYVCCMDHDDHGGESWWWWTRLVEMVPREGVSGWKRGLWMPILERRGGGILEMHPIFIFQIKTTLVNFIKKKRNRKEPKVWY